MKITGLSHLFKWENLHNWWLTKYFFAPLYMYTYIYIYGLNTRREQYMINIILYREHEIKTIIKANTVHIRVARYIA